MYWLLVFLCKLLFLCALATQNILTVSFGSQTLKEIKHSDLILYRYFKIIHLRHWPMLFLLKPVFLNSPRCAILSVAESTDFSQPPFLLLFLYLSLLCLITNRPGFQYEPS
jgi:hypothetical protein